MSQQLPLIIAHRGARNEAPENTGAAFDRALSYPIDGMELDVQMTRDGVPVVYHNRTLHRICGQRQPVSSVDAATFLSMDGGYWFGTAFIGEPLLTLEEVLSRYVHRTQLLVEIKSRPRERRNEWSLKLIHKAVSLLSAPSVACHLRNVSLLSFDPEVLREAARIAPKVKRIWNMPDTAGMFQQATAQLQSDCSQIRHLTGLCVKVSRLSSQIVTLAHDQGKLLLTYTCNKVYQTRKALDMGADVIMTDRPDWMTTFLLKELKHDEKRYYHPEKRAF